MHGQTELNPFCQPDLNRINGQEAHNEKINDPTKWRLM